MAPIALMVLLWLVMLVMAWRMLADLLVWLAATLAYAAWGAVEWLYQKSKEVTSET